MVSSAAESCFHFQILTELFRLFYQYYFILCVLQKTTSCLMHFLSLNADREQQMNLETNTAV